MVCEILMAAEMWQDVLQEVIFPVAISTGIITLPRQFASIVGWQLYGNAAPVFDQFHEYQEGGLGEIDPVKSKYFQAVDMGSGFVSQYDIITPGVLRLVITNPSDAGKAVRFFGDLADDTDAYDPTSGAEGIGITTSYPNSATSQVFSSLTGLQLPGFVGSCALYVVVAGIPMKLAYYDPGEKLPYYHRYLVGVRDAVPNATSPSQVPIRCLCRRQFTPVSAETDFIFPGNQNALELGLQALQERRALDLVVANQLLGLAFKRLDDDLTLYRGSAQISLRLEGMSLPAFCGLGGWGGSWYVN